MSNYRFPKTLREIWDRADARYKSGVTGPANLFPDEDLAFIHSIGHSAVEVFDFIDDCNRYDGEPDFETFLLLASLRRHYFLHVMKGEQSKKIVDTGDLPAKSEKARGIEWLPRLIEKARAKLRGEMSDDLMYGCSGDRGFSKKHDIHLAEILQFVMEHFDDTEAIVDFVVMNSKAPVEA